MMVLNSNKDESMIISSVEPSPQKKDSLHHNEESRKSSEHSGSSESLHFNYLNDRDDATEPLLTDEIGLHETTCTAHHGHQPEVVVQEGTTLFLVQFILPFLMAGLGQLLAGLFLDKFQHWNALMVLPNIYILIPALLGLKGNVEMCLAARLSTQANINVNERTSIFLKYIICNLGTVQVHSILISFLAAIGANVLGWIPKGEFNITKCLIITASCLSTASLTSLFLGSVMVIVILSSRAWKINPDNVATPIAASLGDLSTVCILAYSTNYLLDHETSWPMLPTLVLVGCFLAVPFWWLVASRNELAHESLLNGWQPVVTAMIISCVGGLIMEYSILNFRGIAVYQLIVNGVAGNLVAVQASKLSTYLHMNHSLGESISFSYNPKEIFFGSNSHSHTVRILLAVVVPAHLVFNYIVASLKAGHTSPTMIFMLIYLIASFIQVVILLYICHILIFKMWHRGIDPDNSAIPYLTAIADLLGMIFLSIAFYTLYLIGDKDDDIGD